ncbi:birA, biotin-(acetyl-CoA-carboxylase) ligase [Sphaerochaeta pleomorpha str. Grapes]|uniref:Bifunctional ligase/repressor BirA n=1 Tax=Sphaerochaeta pleomorpha (strain ATCC BAA-1885 / DSM 22778 / Grapes) TaxID=158190 RepID=G8QXS9_SPHPG|nr:biotin--[acetyl-CoA-carboxylase] ligase [Sphaerochaeta pleomorpha]AEV30723.1 birA, biotin-(acetyl-CoA-carboxylase) ligase [Sphaerochaeta pleomorpha str. Grapes]
MSTVQDVLAFLHIHEDTYVSGQLIAQNLGISRSAIWKAIELLRDEGHSIDAVTNKGYRLMPNLDVLDKNRLETLLGGFPVHLFDTIDSTNRFAKQLAAEGSCHGTVVVSASQSQGRGRLGREFSSPKGGLYMSIILRPRCKTEEALLVTSAAAVAVARAVEKVCNLELGIKWVNDLFFRKRKVCGILTEGVIDFEAGVLSSLVVGIGLNYSTPSAAFEANLRSVVTSLYDGPSQVPPFLDANVLVAEIVRTVVSLSDLLPDRSFLQEYRDRSLVLGNTVSVVQAKKTKTALALEIDDDAHLVVEYGDGSIESLGTGEISIRLDV